MPADYSPSLLAILQRGYGYDYTTENQLVYADRRRSVGRCRKTSLTGRWVARPMLASAATQADNNIISAMHTHASRHHPTSLIKKNSPAFITPHLSHGILYIIIYESMSRLCIHYKIPYVVPPLPATWLNT